MQYRFRIPVCGAIILNETLDKCLLVKGWSSKSGWGFPKGKINQSEEYAHCAVREVMEETGYDISPLMTDTYFERTMREQSIRLYIIMGVPETTHFEPRTRKEISQIEWFKLEDLPGIKPGVKPSGRYYMVVPFVSKLKQVLPILRKEMQNRKGGGSGSERNKGSRNKNSKKQPSGKNKIIPPPSPPNEAAEPSATLKSLLGVANGQKQNKQQSGPSTSLSSTTVGHSRQGNKVTSFQNTLTSTTQYVKE
jgi:8-oxo-dGTP pyrophosphatase MutT (NUDIX family)